MSFLFLCCCRPFLRDRNPAREYYDLLEVPKDASVDDIKRAYKKKSLALHPDKLAQRGQTLTPELQAQFQKVKEAYEVLVDPRRRNLYDELGESGLRLVENPSAADMSMLAENFLKSSASDRCALFSFVMGIMALILIFPVLLCLRIDGTIDIPYTALWFPVWAFDALVLLVLLLAVAVGRQKPPEGLEEEFVDDFPQRVLGLVQFCCNILFQIFLTSKLDGYVDWDWAVIFAPWLAWEAINLFNNVVTGMQKLPDGEVPMADVEMLLLKRMEIEAARKGVLDGVLRIIFVGLVIGKLDEQLATTSWWAVFAPLWVYFGLVLLGICRDCAVSKAAQLRLEMALSDPEGQGIPPPVADQIREQAQVLSSRAWSSCCWSVIFVVVAALTVARINGADFTVFIIFIPLFLLMGCITCFMGCAICCVSDRGLNDSEGSPLVNPNAGPSGVPSPSNISPPASSTTGAAAQAGGHKPSGGAAYSTHGGAVYQGVPVDNPTPTSQTAPTNAKSPSKTPGTTLPSSNVAAPSDVVISVPPAQQQGGGQLGNDID